VIVADIYAAREKNTIGIDSSVISEKIDGAEYIKDFDGIISRLSEVVKEDDFVLTMGAGDIYKIGEILINRG